LCFSFISSTHSQVIYSNKADIINIGTSVKYLIDSTNVLSINDVTTNPSLFKKSTKIIPNFGLLKDASVWLKINITNQTDLNTLVLELAQPLLNEVDFYYPVNGAYAVNQSGEKFPFSARQIKNHNFVYELSIPNNSNFTYYFRLKSSEQMALPLFLGSKNESLHSNLIKNLLFGIFFGIIIVMFFYNLFIYFTVRDNIYLLYVIYILVVGLIQGTIEGYTFQFLWPNNSFMAMRGFFFFTALVNITGLQFVRKFLNTKEFIPKIDKGAYVIFITYSIAILLTVYGKYYYAYNILQVFAGLVSLYMFAIAIIVAKKGYRPAKFFVIAWIPLITGIIIYVLKDVGVLQYNIITNYSITIGSSMEVILLSFALADKINILRKEKEVSQAETLQAMRENERIVREQNVILEAKVTERTLELNASNEELQKTLIELKEAESQLVESEKMASLGQLTAGIAHEINNPINFVTSNINPLKRDVAILIDLLHQIETLSLTDLSSAEKQKQINDIKTDIDYDYLKTEIDYLLKGISDGSSRTAEIVKGLRIFSRLDEDDLKKADINEGIDSTLIIINNLLNGRIEIVKKYGGLPFVECYPGKLNQVFMNIITNAIHAVNKKFGEEKGGVITLTTTMNETKVYIKIADNGTGMDETTKKKLFEPFFTTKDVGEGTGLGLSIAYNTIKKHNGQILVNSIIGEGTEFIIELPL
jgi:hypothetical protein